MKSAAQALLRLVVAKTGCKLFSEIEEVAKTRYKSTIAKDVRLLIGNYFNVSYATERVVYFKAQNGVKLALQPYLKTQVNLYANNSELARSFCNDLNAQFRKYDPLEKFFDGEQKMPCIAIPEESSKARRAKGGDFININSLKTVFDELFIIKSQVSKGINYDFVDIQETENAGFHSGNVSENDNRKWHLRKERSSKFRRIAIQEHGTICQACDVDYSSRYGELWNGFVEAHHLFPRSEIKEPKKTDVRKEACVLCANCHRMIHRWMSSEGVKGRLEYNRNDLLNFRKEIIKSDAK